MLLQKYYFELNPAWLSPILFSNQCYTVIKTYFNMTKQRREISERSKVKHGKILRLMNIVLPIKTTCTQCEQLQNFTGPVLMNMNTLVADLFTSSLNYSTHTHIHVWGQMLRSDFGWDQENSCGWGMWAFLEKYNEESKQTELQHRCGWRPQKYISLKEDLLVSSLPALFCFGGADFHLLNECHFCQ